MGMHRHIRLVDSPLHTMRYLLTLPLLCAASAAAMTTVSDFKQLQSVIDACDSRLYVTITNDIIIESPLVLDNAGCQLRLFGADNGIALDGGNRGQIMSIGNQASMSANNLIFRNAKAFGIWGAAMYVKNGMAYFGNCTFAGNQAHSYRKAAWGGAVADEDSVLSFTDCHFDANKAGGGGAVVVRDTRARFKDCTFSNNYAYLGGAVMVRENGSVHFRHCAFRNNDGRRGVRGVGGAVYGITGSSLNFEHCEFSDNISGQGGAVRVYKAIAATFEHCNFINNKVKPRGGIVDVLETKATIKSCKFSDNSPGIAVTGSSIIVRRYSDVKIEYCQFSRNIANGFGDAIRVQGNDAVVHQKRNTFSGSKKTLEL